MSAKKETELVFYAKVGDRSGLEKAVDSEAHEQWTFLILDPEGGISGSHVRVRRTTRDGKSSFEETIKTKTETAGVQDSIESSVDIDEDYFKSWRKAFPCKGVIKTRYIFLSKEVTLEKNGEKIVLPEIKYEVDILMDQDGNPSKWCKIDIELDAVLAYLAEKHEDIKQFDMKVALSSLPLDLQDAFCAVNMTEEQKQAVDAFWNKFSQLGVGQKDEPVEQPQDDTNPPEDTSADAKPPEGTPDDTKPPEGNTDGS